MFCLLLLIYSFCFWIIPSSLIMTDVMNTFGVKKVVHVVTLKSGLKVSRYGPGTVYQYKMISCCFNTHTHMQLRAKTTTTAANFEPGSTLTHHFSVSAAFIVLSSLQNVISVPLCFHINC